MGGLEVIGVLFGVSLIWGSIKFNALVLSEPGEDAFNQEPTIEELRL